jgi:hypothetical protein
MSEWLRLIQAANAHSHFDYLLHVSDVYDTVAVEAVIWGGEPESFVADLLHVGDGRNRPWRRGVSSRYMGANENFVPVVLASPFDSIIAGAYVAAILASDS